MVISRLLRLVNENGILKVQVRWKGLPDSEDTLEPLQAIPKVVPVLLDKLLCCKSTSIALATCARRLLRL